MLDNTKAIKRKKRKYILLINIAVSTDEKIALLHSIEYV